MPEREIPAMPVEAGQFLTVLAEIEGIEEPQFLLINTGESRCSLSPRLLARLRSRFDIQPAGVLIVGSKQEQWYHLRIRVGTVIKDRVPTVFRELPSYPSADGVLGMNWFRLVEPKVKRITLDFERQSLGLDFA